MGIFKKLILGFVFFIISLVYIPCIAAEAVSQVRGQSINGSTGLYSIPSGRIGWEDKGNFAMDLGYRAIINNYGGIAHIPAVTLSLFNWVEISSAYDIQPKIDFISINEDNEEIIEAQNNEDLLLGIKIRLTNNNPAVALGSNFQLINLTNKNDYDYVAYQPYFAITYAGNFLNTKSETSVVFGKTFYTHGPVNNSDIDFGMGLDIIIFDDVFGDAVHWLIDFANFSYSDNAWSNELVHGTGAAWYRGALNTGLRINLAAIPVLSNFKFIIDLFFNDLFDSGGRSFTIGTVFGVSP